MTRGRFPMLLAALLLLQWGAAYGQCHALRAAAAVLPEWVVCVSHDVAGAPAGQDGPVLQADLDCPACHAAPALVDAPVPAVPSVAVAWEPLVFVPQPDALGARAPPPPARGPPAVL